MKLILIYGPEASGKLTVAGELAAITGYRVFHNHVSIEVARSVFHLGTEEFAELSWAI